jgi:hypothetical protein
VGELWGSIVDFFKSVGAFLKAYDMDAFLELLRHFNWREAFSNPMVWLIGLPLIGFLVFKRMYRVIILLITTVAFMLLAQKTLSPPGQSMPLDDLVLFLVGSAGLLGVNVYFFFIRSD